MLCAPMYYDKHRQKHLISAHFFAMHSSQRQSDRDNQQQQQTLQFLQHPSILPQSLSCFLSLKPLLFSVISYQLSVISPDTKQLRIFKINKKFRKIFYSPIDECKNNFCSTPST